MACSRARFGKIANLNRAYVRLRQVKSPEEIDWLRIGAHFSDRGMAGLRDGLRPGLTERELGDLVERAYVADGGTNSIHYIGVTSMAAPNLPVPAQFPSTRRVQAGDIVFAEISAAFFDHAGQVLRSFTVGAEPTPLYRDLHAAADAAFDAVAAVLKEGAMPAQVIEAAGVIEDAGFTIIDDLLHGYGGGYLAPILGSKSRPAGPDPAGAVQGQPDRGDPAQRGDPRSPRRRADRRARAHHHDRHRAHAFIPARLCAGVMLDGFASLNPSSSSACRMIER